MRRRFTIDNYTLYHNRFTLAKLEFYKIHRGLLPCKPVINPHILNAMKLAALLVNEDKFSIACK